MLSPITLFLAHVSEDEPLLRELEQHLKALKRQNLIDFWHAQNVSPGGEWEEEIINRLNSAQVILLLISPAFLASDYCYSVEIRRALERHERGEARVIPIILRAIYWQDSPIGKLQALPEFGQPVTSRKWANRNEAFFEVAKGIRQTIEKLATPSHNQIKNSVQNIKVEADDEKGFSFRDSVALQRKTRICPYCIEEFFLGDCDIVAQMPVETRGEILESIPQTQIKDGDDLEWKVKWEIIKKESEEARNWLIKQTAGKYSGILSEYIDNDDILWFIKQFSRRNPIALSHHKYHNREPRRRCPCCKHILPYNIEEVDNFIVAIIGTTGAGKSHYLTALLHQMQERWIKENDTHIQIQCLTEYVETEYGGNYRNEIYDHFNNVFSEEKHLGATVPTGGRRLEPLIYEMIIRDSSGYQKRRLNLVFYDGSGEDYQRNIMGSVRHIYYADGIIFLLDPGNLASISSQASEYSISKQSALLDSVVGFLEIFYGTHLKKGLHPLPVAMMLSKSDLLKYVGGIVPPYRLFSNPIYALQPDLQGLEMVHNEVKFILGKEDKLLQTIQRFPTVKLFATSATGCPKNKDGRYPYIDPCRVIDPLLWVLHMLGITKI